MDHFFELRTTGLSSELYLKIKPKISNPMALIIPLNGTFEEKYWGTLYPRVLRFLPRGVKERKFAKNLNFAANIFLQRGHSTK